MSPRIVAVGTAVPRLEMAGRNRTREIFFLHSDIDFRHLYFEAGFTGSETVDAMLGRARKGAAEIGGLAIRKCLDRAGGAPPSIGFLSTATCTASMFPQQDTRFVRDLNLSPFTRRTHIGDTGCAAAIVALQTGGNHPRTFLDRRAIAASVEIRSAAMHRDGSAGAALGEAIFAGGSRTLDRSQGSLGLHEADLQYSRDVFRNFGNMSSATVPFVLDRVMTSGRPQPGGLALMAARAAGFAAEGALLRCVQ